MDATEYHSGEFVIQPTMRRLLRNGEGLDVEGKVFDLILLLVQNHAQSLGKQAIVNALWGHRPITDAALSQLIYKARRALNDDGDHQLVIRTIYGRGLQWVMPVEVVALQLDPFPTTGGTAAPELPTTATTTALAPPAANATADRHTSRFRWPAMAIAAVVVLLVLAVGGAWSAFVHRGLSPTTAQHAPTTRPTKIAGLPRIALLPVVNATGDAKLAWVTHGLPGLIGGLLGETRGVAVVDPTLVAKAWNFKLPPGKTRTQHTQDVTGATILVSGTVKKIGELYELSLQLEQTGGSSIQSVSLTGSEPGTMAVAAAHRIRRALNLAPIQAPHSLASPKDPYLAQTFARGVDAAVSGNWVDAKPYFALCAKEIADFLPCQVWLGRAELNTDQLPKAQQTFETVVNVAHARGDTDMVAIATAQLADVALYQNQYATALAQLQKSESEAQKFGDEGLQSSITLKIVFAAGNLAQFELAGRALRRADRLIRDNKLKSKRADFYNAAAFIARKQGDYAAAEKADREALAASTAIGNQLNALGDTFNLGNDLHREQKPAASLALMAYTFQQANKLQVASLEFESGDDMAMLLLNAGVTERLAPVIKRLLQIADEQRNPAWQAYALNLLAARQWADGDYKASLVSARQSVALLDPKQAPDVWVEAQYAAALPALLIDSDSLPKLATQVDAVIAQQPTTVHYAYYQQLIHALAAAATHQMGAANTALLQAAKAAHPDDPPAADLQRAGLLIALANNDPAAAKIALAGFNVTNCNTADVLRLAGQWARKQGNESVASAADARLDSLRKAAIAALNHQQSSPTAQTASRPNSAQG